jgi:hypothetical protein
MTKTEYINKLKSENPDISEDIINGIMRKFSNMNESEFNEALERENMEYADMLLELELDKDDNFIVDENVTGEWLELYDSLYGETEDEPVYERDEMAATYKELNKHLDKAQGIRR